MAYGIVNIPGVSKAELEGKQNEWIAATSGSGSAYTVTLEPAPEALYVGMRITIIPHTASTSTAATLNVNGLGAKSFRERGYTSGTLYAPYASTFLTSGKPVGLVYDGTYWVMTEYTKPNWYDMQNRPATFTPSSHASTGTTYGVGTETQYGHVKLLNNLTTETAGAGALDAYQGKVLADKLAAFPAASSGNLLYLEFTESGTWTVPSNLIGDQIMGSIYNLRKRRYRFSYIV